MKPQEDDTAASHPDDAGRWSWMRGMPLPIYFVLMLALGIWLMMPSTGTPGSILVVYFAVLIASLAALFWRTPTVEIDRRNYIDLSRAQWLGRRGRSKKDDTAGR